MHLYKNRQVFNIYIFPEGFHHGKDNNESDDDQSDDNEEEETGGTARSVRTSGLLLKREIFTSLCAQINDILKFPQYI